MFCIAASARPTKRPDFLVKAWDVIGHKKKKKKNLKNMYAEQERLSKRAPGRQTVLKSQLGWRKKSERTPKKSFETSKARIKTKL